MALHIKNPEVERLVSEVARMAVYAAAKIANAELIDVGEDFSQTDLA